MKNDAEAAKGPGVKRRVNPFSLSSLRRARRYWIYPNRKKKENEASETKEEKYHKNISTENFFSKKTKIGARASPKNRCECSGAGSVGLATSRRIIHLVIIIIIIFNDCITISPASLIFFIFFTQKIKQKFSILGKKKRVWCPSPPPSLPIYMYNSLHVHTHTHTDILYS